MISQFFTVHLIHYEFTTIFYLIWYINVKYA